MAWRSNFNQDTDKDGVGTVTITYTDDDTGKITSYSQRCDINDIEQLTKLCLNVKLVVESRESSDNKYTEIINKILLEVNKIEIVKEIK